MQLALRVHKGRRVRKEFRARKAPKAYKASRDHKGRRESLLVSQRMLFPVYVPGLPGYLVAQNTVQTSGTYFVSASALLVIDSYDGGAYCYDNLASTGTARQYGGSGLAGYTQQASIADSVYVNAGDSIQLRCYGYNGDGATYVYNAALTSTLINTVTARPVKLEVNRWLRRLLALRGRA